jgi:hypothetical protein
MAKFMYLVAQQMVLNQVIQHHHHVKLTILKLIGGRSYHQCQPDGHIHVLLLLRVAY